MEETSSAFVSVNILYGGYDAEPRSSVVCKLEIASLEEDLHAVERGDDCFCPFHLTISTSIFIL